jgi:hypothetical protein
MPSDLTNLAATAAKTAFESACTTWLKSSGTQLSSLLADYLPAVIATATGTFAVEFSTVLLKQLLQTKDASRKIATEVTKLAREPMKTALDQFRIASMLPADTADLQYHREQRFRECLGTLDRALSLAEDPDLPAIHLLRGACALQVRGGGPEAESHLTQYAEVSEYRARVLAQQADAADEESRQSRFQADQIPEPRSRGVGGGFLGMSEAQPRIRKASLLRDARAAERRSQLSREESNRLSDAAACARAVAKTAIRPLSVA